MLHNVPDDATTESSYECLGCGNIVTADSHPGKCPGCGGFYQNRTMPRE